MSGLSIEEELALLRDAYRWTWVIDVARTGYLSLMVYDILLCLPTEIEMIWKARWGSGKLLYLACRYSSLVYLILCIAYQFLVDCRIERTLAYRDVETDGKLFTPSSRVFDNIQYWGAIIIYVPFQVLVGIRTYALYHRGRTIGWCIMGLFMIYMGVAVGLGVLFSKREMFVEIPLRNAPCSMQIQGASKVSIIGLFVAGAIYDAILWGLLVARVYQAYVRGQNGLMRVIFRMGMLYFTFVTVMYICCAIMFSVFKGSKVIIAAATTHSLQAVGSVLSARFILQLRSYLTDLTMTSLSMPPENIMKTRHEVKFGSRGTSSADSSDVLTSVSTPSYAL